MASHGKLPPSRMPRPSILQELDKIRTVTLEYLHMDPDDEDSVIVKSNYHCVAAEPARILAMVEALELFQELPTPEELSALGKLIQDLTGYIKMTAGDKPDPVRDDLLLQARMLLGMTGL